MDMSREQRRIVRGVDQGLVDLVVKCFEASVFNERERIILTKLLIDVIRTNGESMNLEGALTEFRKIDQVRFIADCKSMTMCQLGKMVFKWLEESGLATYKNKVATISPLSN